TNSSRVAGRSARLAAVALLATALVACGSVDRTGRAFWQPYRPNVQQGNWVTQQQIAQLRPGMTREQVRFILGSPTLTPIFHADRWEYPYYMKPGYGKREERRFTVFFENDRVARWEGDPQPTVQPFQDPDESYEPLLPLAAESSEFSSSCPVGAEPAGSEGATKIGTHPQAAHETERAPGESSTPSESHVPVRQPRINIGGGSSVDQSAPPRGTFGPRTETDPLR